MLSRRICSKGCLLVMKDWSPVPASVCRASVPPDNLLNFDGPTSRPGAQHQQLVSILDESPGSAYGQPQTQQQQQPAFAGGWDAFGEAPTAPQAPAPAAVAPLASSSAWADFGADPFGPAGGAAASGVNGRLPEQQAGANGHGGQGAGTALPAGASPAAGQPAAAQAPVDGGGWQAFDAPQANGTMSGAAVGQEQVASPAAAQQKQPEPPKRAELPLVRVTRFPHACFLGSLSKLWKQSLGQLLILHHLGGSEQTCLASGESALDCSLEASKVLQWRT